MELLHILETAVNAVVPIVLLILLGYCLRQKGFLTAEFAKIGNKLGFNVTLPCMLFINVYNIESFAVIQWDIVIYSMVMVCVLFLLGLATVRFMTNVRERRGCILQSVFRSNVAIIGLSLATALGGDSAAATSSIITAFTLPLLNIFAVIALTIYVGDPSEIDVRGVLVKIAKNPLIRGILLGLGCLAIRAFQTEMFGSVVFSLNGNLKFLYTALNNIKSIASPFALVVLGAKFDFSAAKGLLREIIAGTVWRVVLAPLIVIGLAVVLSTHTDILRCGVNEYPALIGLFGSPVAVSSAIMAGQMGNDEQLATQLVVWTSIASIATMFLAVCILMSAGLLAV